MSEQGLRSNTNESVMERLVCSLSWVLVLDFICPVIGHHQHILIKAKQGRHKGICV